MGTKANADQCFLELEAIVDYLDNKRISKKYDWEHLPIASRVLQLAIEGAVAERERIVEFINRMK